MCDDVLPFGGELICGKCRDRLLLVTEPRCRKCGRLLTDECGEYCRDCAETEHEFTWARSVYVYNDAMQDAVFRFKYRGRQEYATFFAESIWEYLGDELRALGAPGTGRQSAGDPEHGAPGLWRQGLGDQSRSVPGTGRQSAGDPEHGAPGLWRQGLGDQSRSAPGRGKQNAGEERTRLPVLVPVPIHRTRLRKRGYNQAALIARELSKLTGLPVCEKIIERVKDTAPQKELSREERRKNMKRAFKLCGNVVELCEAVIIDDIYTTGSTVDEMSRLLRSAGMRDVYVLTVCSGTPL